MEEGGFGHTTTDLLPPIDFQSTADGLSYMTPTKLPPKNADARINTKTLMFEGWHAQTPHRLAPAVNGRPVWIRPSCHPMRCIAFGIAFGAPKSRNVLHMTISVALFGERAVVGNDARQFKIEKKFENAIQHFCVVVPVGWTVQEIKLNAPSGALTIENIRSVIVPRGWSLERVPTTVGSNEGGAQSDAKMSPKAGVVTTFAVIQMTDEKKVHSEMDAKVSSFPSLSQRMAKPIMWQFLERYLTATLAEVRQAIAQNMDGCTLIEKTEFAEVHEFRYGGAHPGSLVLKFARLGSETDVVSASDAKYNQHKLNAEAEFYNEMREVSHHRRNENLLDYVRIATDEKNAATLLMFEKYDGDMFQPSTRDAVMQRGKQGQEPGELAKTLLATADGMLFMHQQNWIHVDINPQNILVKLSEKKKLEVRLWNFAFSIKGKSNTNRYPLSALTFAAHRALVETGFSPPELALADLSADPNCILMHETDYASFAMTVLYVLTEQRPFLPFCDWATRSDVDFAVGEHKWNECVDKAMRLVDEHPLFFHETMRGPLSRLLSFSPQRRSPEDLKVLLQTLEQLAKKESKRSGHATSCQAAQNNLN